ncbi:hypothetical protein TNCV_1543631 [Trichonephila clavipes]|nr:hypothetical protein TNCV_1543631 [Trichonephila clavipes]
MYFACFLSEIILKTILDFELFDMLAIPTKVYHTQLEGKKLPYLTQWRDNPSRPRPTVLNLVYVTLDPEVHEQMFQSGGQSEAKPPALSSQASLVLIYQPTGGSVNLPQPGV